MQCRRACRETGQRSRGQARAAAREKGSIYSVNLSVDMPAGPASSTVELQTLYRVKGRDAYGQAFEADAEDAELGFKNSIMGDGPTCGPSSTMWLSRSCSFLMQLKVLFHYPLTRSHLLHSKEFCVVALCQLVAKL